MVRSLPIGGQLNYILLDHSLDTHYFRHCSPRPRCGIRTLVFQVRKVQNRAAYPNPTVSDLMPPSDEGSGALPVLLRRELEGHWDSGNRQRKRWQSYPRNYSVCAPGGKRWNVTRNFAILHGILSNSEKDL